MPKDVLKNWSSEAHVRYYSHFSGLWTSFNAWYKKQFGKSSDRENINEIRKLPGSHELVKAFQEIYNRKDLNYDLLLKQISSLLQSKIIDEQVQGFAEYAQNNVLTKFVQFVWTNSTMNQRLWCGNESHKPTAVNRHSKQIATMFVNTQTYREAYSKLREFESQLEIMDKDPRSVQSVLKEFGINSLGSCFYLDPDLGEKSDSEKSPHAKYLKDFVDEKLGQLYSGKENEYKGLFADIIEMLYAVRNACVHGSFKDPCSRENNDLLQSAFEFMHALILEFLEEDTSNLHP